VFPLAIIEEYQGAGACAVRKDICIDEFDIAIELKCTRDMRGMTIDCGAVLDYNVG